MSLLQKAMKLLATAEGAENEPAIAHSDSLKVTRSRIRSTEALPTLLSQVQERSNAEGSFGVAQKRTKSPQDLKHTDSLKVTRQRANSKDFAVSARTFKHADSLKVTRLRSLSRGTFSAPRYIRSNAQSSLSEGERPNSNEVENFRMAL